jgi:hypothetical protein
MSSVKRITSPSGALAPYDIYANVVTVHGNLYVIGNSSVIQSSNTAIYDNTIVLNAGETGAGVTLGTAGVTVSRGSLPNVSILWNESKTNWQLSTDGTTYANILTTSSGGGAAGGSDTQVQYNSTGFLTGVSNFTFTNGNLKVYNTIIGNGNVSTSASSNQNLMLTADGAGHVMVNDVLMLTFQGTAPTNVASNVQVFANTVGTAGSGIYVVNSSTGDELITKMRAIAFNLIFK